MKNLNVSQPRSGGSPASRFQAAKAMAFTFALADPELIEPELVAWKDRATSMASPELEGCYSSYEHFGPGPFVNLRDDQGNEMICRIGGAACVPLDEWISKLT